MFARVRKWYDGAGWFVGLAVVLFIFALLAVLLGLQSPDHLQWIGTKITGTEQNGLVYYRWAGQNYTISVPGNGSAKAITVYLDPGSPSTAITNNIFSRVLALVLVGIPALGGVLLLIAGGTRNYRWRRRNFKRAREMRL